MSHERYLSPEVVTALERLDDLVLWFEQHPDPDVQEQAVQVLQSVDVIHRRGLRRMSELLKSADLMQRALDIPEFRLLFELYDLAEGGDRARINALLDSVRPVVESQAGTLELVDVKDGVVVVRLALSGQGHQEGVDGLRPLVEQVLREGMPDFERLEFLESRPAPPRNFVPLASLRPKRRNLTWETVMLAGGVSGSSIWGCEVKGVGVLIVYLDGVFYAYRNACPGTPLPLHGGQLDGDTLECPWHHCRFNLRSGKRLTPGGLGLGVMPIAVEDGEVRIGIREDVAA